jgi:hypothetical protein
MERTGLGELTDGSLLGPAPLLTDFAPLLLSFSIKCGDGNKSPNDALWKWTFTSSPLATAVGE